jgi:hypothetical protein
LEQVASTAECHAKIIGTVNGDVGLDESNSVSSRAHCLDTGLWWGNAVHKFALTLIAASVLGFTTVQAETHLIPEDSIYSPMMNYQPGYRGLEMVVFAPAFDETVRARVIAEPSFANEFAVGVRETGGEYRIFYYVAPQHLWDYEMLGLIRKGEIASSKDGKSTTADEIRKLQASLPSDPSSIKLMECELPIDPQVAQTLVRIWKVLLLQTHYDEDADLGVDGDTYHFSMRSGYEELAGKVWSPPESADIGRLIAIVNTVKKTCGKSDKKLLSQLWSQIIDIDAHMSATLTNGDIKK